jgi:hypothetical protein
MSTSRSQLNRLLNPDSDSVTLETVTRAGHLSLREVVLVHRLFDLRSEHALDRDRASRAHCPLLLTVGPLLPPVA